MQHSLYIAVARLVRYCQWAATTLFLGCVYIMVAKNLYFEPVGRALMIALAALPPALFLVGLYFFEARQFRLYESRRQTVFSATVFLLLASPAFCLNWRFTLPLKEYMDYFFYVAATLFSITSIMPARAASEKDGLVKELLLHYKFVMHDGWPLWLRQSEPLEALDPDTAKRITAERAQFYSQTVDDLLAFQRTLTCPELDGAIAARQVLATVTKKQMLSAVDIGGGDGRFTATFIRALEARQWRITPLLNIDPAPRTHDSYFKAIEQNTSLRRPQVTCDAHEAEETTLPPCDMIIASHSLYAIFDKARASGEGELEVALRKLLAPLRPGGAVILVMSSSQSLAICAKRKIYDQVFGNYRFDTVAEDLQPILTKNGWIAKQLQSDSVIDLTEALRTFAETHEVSSLFIQWASYFLRCNLSRLPARHVVAIAESFYTSCFKLRQLPEPMQATALSAPELAPHLDSLVLPHKSTIYLLRALTKA